MMKGLVCNVSMNFILKAKTKIFVVYSGTID